MGKIINAFFGAVEALKKELYVTISKIATGDTTALSKSDRVAAVISGSGAVLFCTAGTASAAKSIIAQANTMLSTYYTKIAGIATLIAAFCLLIAVIWAMVSPGQGAQTPISWAKKIIICWILVLAIGGIATLIQELTNGMGFNPSTDK